MSLCPSYLATLENREKILYVDSFKVVLIYDDWYSASTFLVNWAGKISIIQTNFFRLLFCVKNKGRRVTIINIKKNKSPKGHTSFYKKSCTLSSALVPLFYIMVVNKVGRIGHKIRWLYIYFFCVRTIFKVREK